MEILRRTQMSPNFTVGRNMPLTGIVIHWWDDPAKKPSLLGTVNWLCNRNSGVSAHYVVSGRQIYTLVDEANMAWHAREANSFTIGIEVDPNTPEETYETVAWLTADICHRRGFNPVTSVKGHYFYVKTQCCGTINLGRIISGTQKHLSGSTGEGEDVTNQDFVRILYNIGQPGHPLPQSLVDQHAEWLRVEGRHAEWGAGIIDGGDQFLSQHRALAEYWTAKNEARGNSSFDAAQYANDRLSGGSNIFAVMSGDFRVDVELERATEAELVTRTQERDARIQTLTEQKAATDTALIDANRQLAIKEDEIRELHIALEKNEQAETMPEFGLEPNKLDNLGDYFKRLAKTIRKGVK